MNNKCVLCKNEPETISHLILELQSSLRKLFWYEVSQFVCRKTYSPSKKTIYYATQYNNILH